MTTKPALWPCWPTPLWMHTHRQTDWQTNHHSTSTRHGLQCHKFLPRDALQSTVMLQQIVWLSIRLCRWWTLIK